MNLDVIAAVLLVVVLAWFIWFWWGVFRGYPHSGRWQAGRIAVAAVVALVAVGAASYWLMNSRTVQVLGDHVAHVDTTRKVVALTFDDGPSDLFASELIADLQRYDAHGTFYVIGAAAADQPQALRSLIASGQEIGNHTFEPSPAGLRVHHRRERGGDLGGRRHPRRGLHESPSRSALRTARSSSRCRGSCGAATG